MPQTYKNKEYIDFIRTNQLLVDTVDEGGARVTEPFKVKIRDLALLIAGVGDGVDVVIEYSPDEMETKKEDLDVTSMRWFSRNDGTFNLPGTNQLTFWENIDAPEGWLRIKLLNPTASTNVSVQARPRVEFAGIL